MLTSVGRRRLQVAVPSTPAARQVRQSETVQTLVARRRLAFNGTRVAAQMATGEQVVNRDLVAAALGRLTQEHQDVLRECYFRGKSVAQAALALDIAPDMVKSRAYYALRGLRLAIEELTGSQ